MLLYDFLHIILVVYWRVNGWDNVLNIMTVDVEEMYHAELLRGVFNASRPIVAKYAVKFLLKIIETYSSTATFFTVGEILEHFPELKTTIKSYDCEVGFHGWQHEPLWSLTPKEFKEHIRKFKKIAPTCVGYRAPCFSLTHKTSWAINILMDENFIYDSSIFPIITPMYRNPRSPSYPFVFRHSEKKLIEFPLAVYDLAGIRFPVAGGVWLRLLNYNIIERAIRKLNRKSLPAVIYLHTWEILPYIHQNSFHKGRGGWRITLHMFGMNTVLKKLILLLKNFRFVSVIDFMKEYGWI